MKSLLACKDYEAGAKCILKRIEAVYFSLKGSNVRANNLGRPVEILLVEDNFDDAEFVQLAFQEANVVNQMHHVEDGQGAIAFLMETTHLRPDLILLDLELIKLDGWEVLHFIRHHESLKEIPVIILTTSTLEADVRYAYQNYSNCYLHKPAEFNTFVEIVTQFRNFWLQNVELPSQV